MVRRTADAATTITDEAAAVIEVAMADNAMVEYNPSENSQLAGSLMGIRSVIDRAAAAQVALETAGETGYSQINIRAMSMATALRMVGGLDLTAILLRADYLRTLQVENLVAFHPQQYASLQALAQDNGLSISEMTQILDLVNIVFPYVQNTLQLPVAEFWTRIGKSNIREMMPVLKSLITGEASDTASTRHAVEHLIEDQIATMRASNPDVFEDIDGLPAGDQAVAMAPHLAEARRFAVEHLIELGELLPNRTLRETLRPARTEAIGMAVMTVGENFYLLSRVTPDQLNMIQNKMGERATLMSFDVPEDQHERQLFVNRNNFLRGILLYLSGQQ